MVIAHTRELAYQIANEYQTLSKYLPEVKVAVFFGGLPIRMDEECLVRNHPNIVVGTPGRLLALVQKKKLKLDSLRYFIVDECDHVLKDNGRAYLSFAGYMFYYKQNAGHNKVFTTFQ